MPPLQVASLTPLLRAWMTTTYFADTHWISTLQVCGIDRLFNLEHKVRSINGVYQKPQLWFPMKGACREHQ